MSSATHWYLAGGHIFVLWLTEGTQRKEKWRNDGSRPSMKSLQINDCWSLHTTELLASRYLCPNRDKLGPLWGTQLHYGQQRPERRTHSLPPWLMMLVSGQGTSLWAMTMCRYFPFFLFVCLFFPDSFLPSSSDLHSPASSGKVRGASLVILHHPYLCTLKTKPKCIVSPYHLQITVARSERGVIQVLTSKELYHWIRRQQGSSEHGL